MDEKSSVQALDRTQPSLPMVPGRAQTMTHDYKRRCQMVCVNTSMEVSSDDDGCYGIEQGCAGGAGAA